MPGLPFIAGCILIPLAFGLIPAFLPPRVPTISRWILWLMLIALSGWFVLRMSERPHPLTLLALAIFCLSSLLSLYVLVAETKRAGAGGWTAAKG